MLSESGMLRRDNLNEFVIQKKRFFEKNNFLNIYYI
jgi:hypothetical protein